LLQSSETLEEKEFVSALYSELDSLTGLGKTVGFSSLANEKILVESFIEFCRTSLRYPGGR
jgi:hypothetical protein